MNAETLAKLNDKSIQEMRDNLKREIAALYVALSKLESKDQSLYMEQLRRQLEHETEATK